MHTTLISVSNANKCTPQPILFSKFAFLFQVRGATCALDICATSSSSTRSSLYCFIVSYIILCSVTFSDGDNPPPSSSRAAHTIINSSNLSKYPGETFILRQSVRVDGETLHDIDRACFKTPYSLKFFINFPYREKYQFIEVCELSGDRIAGYVAFRARPENCTYVQISFLSFHQFNTNSYIVWKSFHWQCLLSTGSLALPDA